MSFCKLHTADGQTRLFGDLLANDSEDIREDVQDSV